MIVLIMLLDTRVRMNGYAAAELYRNEVLYAG